MSGIGSGSNPAFLIWSLISSKSSSMIWLTTEMKIISNENFTQKKSLQSCPASLKFPFFKNSPKMSIRIDVGDLLAQFLDNLLAKKQAEKLKSREMKEV